MKKLARILRKLALALAVLVLTLLGIEAVMRMIGYEPITSPMGPRYLYMRDEELGLRLRPHFEGRHRHPEFDVALHINSLGFRDREITEQKAAGVVRILSLGDSYAYGYGVEANECYARRLEASLNRAAGQKRFEVINMGVPSYTNWQMGLLLRRWIDRLGPDIVLFTFLIADDLDTNLQLGHSVRGGIPFAQATARYLDGSWLHSFALEHSQLLLTAITLQLRWEHGLDLGKLNLPVLDRPGEVPYPVAINHQLREASADTKKKWEFTSLVFERFFAIVRGGGAAGVLLNIPLPYMVDEEYWLRAISQHGIDASEVNLDSVPEHLAPLCARHGIHFLDLVPGFRREGAGADVFFARNLHFNPAGHAVAAHLIERFLRREQLIQP